MTDRPIGFIAPIVNALIDGRTTMSRRMAWREDNRETDSLDLRPTIWQNVKPGDRLWVRETYAPTMNPETGEREPPGIYYSADWKPGAQRVMGKAKSGRYMPRKFSRITLHVTAVRLERLQMITNADAMASGIARYQALLAGNLHPFAIDAEGHYSAPSARESFRLLWSRLHGDGEWEINPEVVVLSFKVVLANIDAPAAAIAA